MYSRNWLKQNMDCAKSKPFHGSKSSVECSRSLIVLSVGRVCSQQVVYMSPMCPLFQLLLSNNNFCWRGKTKEGHSGGCSELWSLPWLSSSVASLGELAKHWSPTTPDNSDGGNRPFFTLTSSLSRAAAPCCPPFTRFHFILLFWNHTFTCEETQISEMWLPQFLNILQCNGRRTKCLHNRLPYSLFYYSAPYNM